MPKVRANGVYSLYDAEQQQYVAPKPDEYFDDTDPLVRQHRWAFSTDEELAGITVTPPVDSVPIESMTAAPGEKRRTAPRKK